MIARGPMISDEIRKELAAGLGANPDLPVKWRPEAWSGWVPVEAVPAHSRESISKQQLYALANEVGGRIWPIWRKPTNRLTTGPLHPRMSTTRSFIARSELETFRPVPS